MAIVITLEGHFQGEQRETISCLVPVFYFNGSFTLAKFFTETVSDSDMKQYLPWPPWATQQKIETILSVSCRPRWPRQVLCHVAAVAVTDSFAHKLCQSKRSIRKTKSYIKNCFPQTTLKTSFLFRWDGDSLMKLFIRRHLHYGSIS